MQADKEARSSSPTFMRNTSLIRGMEGGMEGFKLRSRLLKTKLTKTEVEELCSELTKLRIINLEDLANLDSQSLLSLNVQPRVRSILWQTAKKHCESFRLKDLLVESNCFVERGTTTQSANDACERVASCLHRELDLRRWKDFSLISPNDLNELPDISAEESVQISSLVSFSREANLGSLQRQFTQVQQSMEVALQHYSELVRNLSLFQNFVTAGVPLDASLNELSNLKAKLFDQRDAFIRDLSGTQSTAGDSIEEDSTTHAGRPSASTITPGGPWKSEPTLESTSFRQQVRSLQLNTSGGRLFRKSFVDPNLNFISFVGEKKGAGEEEGLMESMVVTFEKKKNSPQGDSSLMLIQSAIGDEVMRLSAVGKAKEMVDVMQKTPMMTDFELARIKDPSGEFKKSLLALETKLVQQNYKIGVLSVRAGQTREDEFFANSEGSKAYTSFLKLLGDRVSLKGWKQFTAGLDVRDNRNGQHSIFATLDQVSVMFHVATMMPFENGNEDQKLERKRHIGNDVVCIVFVEEGASFNPASIRTEFIHVYAIVTPITINNRLYFKLEIATKEGVAKFSPSIPNCLFPNSKTFGQYLLTKLVNADVAASAAPVFKKRLMRTRNALLGDLIAQAKHSKWLKRAAVGQSTLTRDPSATSIKSSSGGVKIIKGKASGKDEEDSVSTKGSDKKISLAPPFPQTKEKEKERDKSPR
jgi:hypothetical protein